MCYPDTGVNYNEEDEINEVCVHWNLGLPKSLHYVVVFGLGHTEEGWYFDRDRKNIEWEGPGIYYFNRNLGKLLLTVPKEEIIAWTYPVVIVPYNPKAIKNS
jgi:hypothetical protein